MRRPLAIALVAIAATLFAGLLLFAGGDDDGAKQSGQTTTPAAPGGRDAPAGQADDRTNDSEQADGGGGGSGGAAPPADPRPLVQRGLAVGLSGEQPATFGDPRYRALALRRARAVASWDLAARGERQGAAPDPARFPALADEHRRLLQWLSAARSTGVREVLIAVKPSRDHPGLRPSRARYERAVRALLGWLDRAGYGGFVKAVSPWNEPNLSSTASAPEVAGSYFDAVRDICATRGCTPVAGEFADRPVTPEFLSRYLAGVGQPAPRVWGWHSYEDAWDRQRDASFPRLRTLLSAIAPNAEVWLTEQGGIVRRRMPGDDGRREQGAAAAAADLRFLIDRAPSVDPRIKRFYLYQWQGEPAPRWDSGVIAPDGHARLSYCVFARAAMTRAPAACR